MTATGKGRSVKRRTLLNLSILQLLLEHVLPQAGSGCDGDSKWLCQLGTEC